MESATKISIEDLINSIYNAEDVSQYINLILQRYHSLTLYVIEPYVPQNEGEPLKFPSGENYSIYDYGGRLVIAPNDVFSTPVFACGEFLTAVEEALEMVLDAQSLEIAVLGDHRAKLFVWDRCERLKSLENNPIKLINYTPPESFGITREAVMRYLQEHGMRPKTRPSPSPK